MVYLKHNFFTHRVGWAAEGSELWRCISVLDLQGHAGTGTQLCHHTLWHNQSRVKWSHLLNSHMCQWKSLLCEHSLKRHWRPWKTWMAQVSALPLNKYTKKVNKATIAAIVQSDSWSQWAWFDSIQPDEPVSVTLVEGRGHSKCRRA